MERNNIRPSNLDAVNGRQNFNQDRSIMERAQMLAGGMMSPGAQMNNTDNYKMISIDKLVEFSGHPFQVRDDSELEGLAESIKESGVVDAILVRPVEDGKYEILAGHRRVAASKKNGNYDIPAKILNVDDNEATIIMTNTNLKQREKILHSERAKAYKMQIEAYKKQGKRNDLIMEIDEQINLSSNRTEVKCARDIVAERNKTSALQVTRYLRLNELIKPLLDLVDIEDPLNPLNQVIPFTAGVSLSFLKVEEQQLLTQAIEEGVIKKIDLKLAEELKSISKAGQLNETVIKKMFTKSEEKNKITAYVAFQGATKNALKRLKKVDYSGVEINQDELEQIIIEAINNYAEDKKR